ncbi:MAG TPA: efflux RND transporter periplasmic adaptor subunit, partial [Polyangiaceae bacterium]|nr:efflux RND transporter periplasmic adaptor subunit [Polyangiaceae bacterium]
MSLIAILILALASACGRDVGGDSHAGEDEHAGEEGHENEGHKDGEEGHKDEVKISPEALKLADIRFDTAQRRALTGGVAVPAEVQFEPSSTAHVGPLVPGRLTKVSVGLGEQVKRGQLLGIVASTDVSAARSKLAQARARLSAAESTLKRQQQLSSEGIGARRSLIDAEAEVSEIKADVKGLRSQLSVFGSGGGGG